jgi:hypothetical protein
VRAAPLAIAAAGALAVAAAAVVLTDQTPQLGADGEVDIVDVQQEMLDHVMARAARRSLGNISPHLASAEALPFPDDWFDAACLVTVLGEIPRPAATLAGQVIEPQPAEGVQAGSRPDSASTRSRTVASAAVGTGSANPLYWRNSSALASTARSAASAARSGTA